MPVIHLAGVSRAHDSVEIERVNPWPAEQLVASLRRLGRPICVVHRNSIHARGDSVFGVARRRAAEILAAWGSESGAPVMDMTMPNLFGELGVPNHNPVVATFCHALARGETPNVVGDKELPLLHVGVAVDRLLDLAVSPEPGQVALEVGRRGSRSSSTIGPSRAHEGPGEWTRPPQAP